MESGREIERKIKKQREKEKERLRSNHVHACLER